MWGRRRAVGLPGCAAQYSLKSLRIAFFRTSFDCLLAVGFIVRESNGTYSYLAAEVKQEDTGPAFNQELLCWRIANLSVVSGYRPGEPTFNENTWNHRRDGSRNDNRVLPEIDRGLPPTESGGPRALAHDQQHR